MFEFVDGYSIFERVHVFIVRTFTKNAITECLAKVLKIQIRVKRFVILVIEYSRLLCVCTVHIVVFNQKLSFLDVFSKKKVDKFANFWRNANLN